MCPPGGCLDYHHLAAVGDEARQPLTIEQDPVDLAPNELDSPIPRANHRRPSDDGCFAR